VQPFHALPKSRLSLAVVLNVTVGKEVKLVHPSHAWFKPVALDRSNVLGNSSSEVQFFQQEVKFVPLDRSSVPGNSVRSLQLYQQRVKFIPPERSRVPGKLSSEVQPYQLA